MEEHDGALPTDNGRAAIAGCISGTAKPMGMAKEKRQRNHPKTEGGDTVMKKKSEICNYLKMAIFGSTLGP